MYLKSLTKTKLRFDMNLSPDMRRIQQVLVEIERAFMDLENRPSGGVGTPRIPILLAADGSQSFEGGDFLVRLLVKPVADIPAFKVGLTVGGEELITSQPLVANKWHPLALNQFLEVDGSVYFGGITQPVEIIAFYEPGTSGKFKIDTVLTKDTFFPFTAGIYVKRALVKVTSPLTSFQIGSAEGLSDIISQPLSAGWHPLDIDYYFDEPGSLYFAGVSSSVQIILYYE